MEENRLEHECESSRVFAGILLVIILAILMVFPFIMIDDNDRRVAEPGKHNPRADFANRFSGLRPLK
jgi:hypothetical protein